MERITGDFKINIGEQYTPRSTVVEQFRRHGVEIASTTVAGLRSGDLSGLVSADKLECARVLETDDGKNKTDFYLAIANASSGISSWPSAEKDGSSVNWREATSQELIDQGIVVSPDQIKRVIPAMRADLLFRGNTEDSSIGNPIDNTSQEALRQAATDFFHDTKGLRSPRIADIYDGWDKKTALSFYENLYRHSTGNYLGIWRMYEMKIFLAHYKRQGDDENHLTPFDKIVLNSHILDENMRATVDGVRSRTQIPVRRQALEAHRNVLAYGNVKNPMRD